MPTQHDDNVWVTTIAPLLGNLTAMATVLAPLPTILHLRRHQPSTLGALNPLPLTLILLNALSWIIYGLALADPYLVGPNLVGFAAGQFYIRATYLLSSPMHQRATDALTTLFPMALVTAAALVALHRASVQVLGWFCIAALVGMYASPLSTLAKVVRLRNAASIHAGFALTGLVNGLLWGVYGYVAIGNAFVWGPNLVGAALALVQVAFKVGFGFGSREEVGHAGEADVLVRDEDVEEEDVERGVVHRPDETSRLL
ncbi:hypothetical protein BCR44DRAFT_51343 [Catenaria anguillulae PL171]|uniref:Bidirectional sugar transporter SWEET n=1 Tax=Catenaria anguillulae PL171 TaxID=765915 RepID=A0A1Y2I016_9FUNG|nr:hypothetical protein BCR44DRAFT_51343 [Catenaria anguillulae PL171]